MPETAYIGLGSNMGNKEENINKALELLGVSPGIKVKKVSSLYRTAPVGNNSQDWFLNNVAEVETGLSPQELLSILFKIEDKLGRVRTVRWGPRIIDLDLLIFGNEEIQEPGLTVPHPRMFERAFVMAPLAEIAPEIRIPGGGTAAALAELLAKQQIIEKES